MNSAIERAHPVDITYGVKELSARQQRILDALPGYGSRTVVKKRDVSMIDLSAMTAKTGDEFAMFTRKGERLIVRGNEQNASITVEDAISLRNEGYRWSGHTHPGIEKVHALPSGIPGDRGTLLIFQQRNSVIYNSAGKFYVFGEDEKKED